MSEGENRMTLLEEILRGMTMLSSAGQVAIIVCATILILAAAFVFLLALGAFSG